jgi:hypothetical protein
MVTGKYTRISEDERAGLSPLRQKAIKLLEDNVPVQGLTSDQPAFARLTGYSTAALKEKWKTMPRFTTCNAFGGNYALLLGAPAGCWLSRGILQLDYVKKEVPESWKAQMSGGVPQPGDIFSMPYVDPDTKAVQTFGHIGVFYCWHDTIFYDTVESGQGGLKAGLDSMKWKADQIYNPRDFTGWVDIEVYINGLAAKKP